MINLHTDKIKKLPPHLKHIITENNQEDLVLLCKALQGGIISYGMTTKQKSLLNRIKFLFNNNIQELNSEWDFVSHKHKMYIDSKSPSYNNNIPVEQQANKYIKANKEGYKMIFIITGDGNMMWPIQKYKKLGIHILTEQEFIGAFNGETFKL